MAQVTDPALLGQLNSAPQTEAPTIYRTPPKAPTQAQIDANQRADRAEARADRAESRTARKDSLAIQKTEEELAGGDVAKSAEGEKKAAAFLIRALGSNEAYEKTGVGPRSLVGQAASDTFPNALNVLPHSIGNSPDRQVADSAQDEFIAASLRQDSGAAIPEEEMERQRRIYFPMPGDSPEALEQKKQARLRAIEGLKQSSGRLLDETLERYNALSSEGAPLTADIDAAPAMGVPGEKIERDGYIVGFYDAQGNRVDIDAGPNFDADGNPIPKEDMNSTAQDMFNQFYAGVGDVAQGVGDTLGIVANPLNMGINAVAGTDLSTDLGQTFRDATGAPENASPTAAAINRGGASVLTGAGGANALMRAGMGAGNAVVNTLAQQPIQQGVAGSAAGLASEQTRQAGGGPGLQALAGLGGGIGAFGGANALMRAAQPKQLSNLAQTAQRQGVDLVPADAGGPTVKRASSAAAQSPLSAAPIINQGKRSTDQLHSAVNRNTRNAVSEDEAGELARKGGDLFIKKTSERGSKLYERAGEAAEGTQITPKTALDIIDGEIAKLSELPETNATLIKDLGKLKSDISSGVSVSGLRDARTQLGGATFDGKLRSGNEKRIYKGVLNALSEDIQAGLTEAGKGDAARMFKVADNFWKQRVEQIDEVLQPIMGKGKSGEDILKSIESMARGQKGGVQRLSRLMRELPEEQAQAVRETVISRLGKATAGQQDDTGTGFSASTFLTNWNKMSAKGKAVLFQDGKQRKNLDDIARLASATKEAQKYANTSNTAAGITGNTMILGGVAYINPMAAIIGAASQYLTGQLLASPRFANWLSKVPANPAAQKQHVKRLSAIASAEPIIANDVKSIQSYLSNAFAASPTRAAAQEESNGGSKPPSQ